jgi:dipeptidyl aminopeptidase/acylaminoacyl peptidase
VAFIRGYPTGRHPEVVIGLVSVDGGRVRELPAGDHGSIGSLEWSPDGTRLAYTAEVDPPRFLVGDVPPIAHKASAKADDTPTAPHHLTDWRLTKADTTLVAPVRHRSPPLGAGAARDIRRLGRERLA